MNIVLRKPRMTREEFFAWAGVSDEKYEFDGFQPVAMTRPNIAHARIAGNLQAALRSRLQGGPCDVYSEVGVATVNDAVRYPDAVITCTATPGNSYLIEKPVIVFEVISPGNTATDRIIKVREYLAVPSIHTYVIVEQTGPGLTLMRRSGNAWATTTLVSGETLRLEQPNLEIPVDEIYEGLFPPDENPAGQQSPEDAR